jgi:hypothetical protein
MRRIILCLQICFIAIILFGCSYTPETKITNNLSFVDNITKIVDNSTIVKKDIMYKNASSIKSKDKCEQSGGVWHSWSYWQMGQEACDMPYPDAQKVCFDSADCVSNKCLYNGPRPIIDTPSSGECAKWISTSCVTHHYYIEKGRIKEDICVE